ncbi:MAG: molybdopterin molybdotransferase MoeA [Alphaproteobacteria bacterium GM202ARS2]|nr:molybdopterin molybdotransferase MoeA [Alphaproteobacteria bacterium GM202ARS2]
MEEHISVERALAMLQEQLLPVAAVETVDVAACFGRVLGEDITSSCHVPPHDNAAVDGYGISGHEPLKVGQTWDIITDAGAGDDIQMTLKAGQAVRVLTGANLSVIGGLDTVLMDEHCHRAASKLTLQKADNLRQGVNYRHRGEDIKKGQNVLEQGVRLRPQDMAILAAIGRTSLAVRRPLRVGILSSGNEVHDPHQGSLPVSGIYDSNRYGLRGLLQAAGAVVDDLGIIADDAKSTAKMLKKGAETNDLLVTSGGISASQSDHIGAVLRAGALSFWRLRMKPGRPLAFGMLGKTPILALPGNPVAVMVTFMIFVRCVLHIMGGRTWQGWRRYPLTAQFAMKKKAGRREWLRAVLQEKEGAVTGVTLFPKKGAGILTSLVHSHGLVDLAEERQQVTEGERVLFTPWTELLW